MNIADYLRDYRDIDPDMKLVISHPDIINFINKSIFSATTKDILIKLYTNLTRLNKHAFLMLHRYPCENTTVDLTFFEGSGFYHQDQSNWIYHKGGGCIEALAIKDKFNLNSVYGAFGCEYPGYLGTFSSSSILGVKRLWQCIHEFAASFTLLAHNIENNDFITCYEDVIGQIAIPLCIVSLPKLSLTIQNNLYNKPDSIRKSYAGMFPENQAAKILMLVPSPIRGTDNYPIESKWLETNNIFYRTLNLRKTQINKFDKSPFWNKDQTEIRARTISSMLSTGFIFQPISAHLQNYYVIPSIIKNKINISAADFCDFLPSKLFNDEQLECILQNILNGWRIAESSGPMYTSYHASISLQQIYDLADSFFKELLNSHYHKDVGKFYLLLPFSSCVSIVKIFYHYNSKNISIEIWEQFLNMTVYGKIAREKIIYLCDRYKNELNTLYKPLSDLRPPFLINEITNHLKGKESEISKIILIIYDKVISSPKTDSLKKAILYHVGYAIEISFFINSDTLRLLKLISSNLNYISKIQALTIYFLKRYINMLDDASLMQFLKNHLEEIMHIKHHDLRNWILSIENPEIIKQWVIEFKEVTKDLISYPIKLLQDYFGFIFKRDNILELIENSYQNNSIRSKLNDCWDGKERPIYRSYPIIEFKKDIHNKDLRQSFMSFAKFLHKIGYDL